PHPLGPTSTRNSLSWISRLARSTATTLPNRLVTPSRVTEANVSPSLAQTSRVVPKGTAPPASHDSHSHTTVPFLFLSNSAISFVRPTNISATHKQKASGAGAFSSSTARLCDTPSASPGGRRRRVNSA